MKTIEVLVRQVGGILDGNHYTYHPTIPDGRRISRQELANALARAIDPDTRFGPRAVVSNCTIIEIDGKTRDEWEAEHIDPALIENDRNDIGRIALIGVRLITDDSQVDDAIEEMLRWHGSSEDDWTPLEAECYPEEDEDGEVIGWVVQSCWGGEVRRDTDFEVLGRFATEAEADAEVDRINAAVRQSQRDAVEWIKLPRACDEVEFDRCTQGTYPQSRRAEITGGYWDEFDHHHTFVAQGSGNARFLRDTHSGEAFANALAHLRSLLTASLTPIPRTITRSALLALDAEKGLPPIYAIALRDAPTDDPQLPVSVWWERTSGATCLKWADESDDDFEDTDDSDGRWVPITMDEPTTPEPEDHQPVRQFIDRLRRI